MASPVITDDFFGLLQWDRIQQQWQTSIDYAYFQGSGKEIPEDEPEPTPPPAANPAPSNSVTLEMFDATMAEQGFTGPATHSLPPLEQRAIASIVAKLRQEVINKQQSAVVIPVSAPKAFELFIDVSNNHHAPPSEAQRDAWKRFLRNTKPICAEIMRQALAMYRRQRRTRIHWWKEIYGPDDLLLPKVLPPIASAKALKAFIRPRQFYIQRDWCGDGAPLIGILFTAAWDTRGFAVLVRNGRVIEVGNPEIATHARKNEPLVNHPVFGPMRAGKREWEGVFRWEPVRRFYEIAEWRDYLSTHPPGNLRGFLPTWDFIDGRFDLRVAAWDGEPSTAAIELYQQFTADPERSANQVLEAIFRYYQSVIENYRSAMQNMDGLDVIAPRIKSIDDLRPLMTFQSLSVFGSEVTRKLSIGLGFHCSWEGEHGLGLRWAGGKVEEVGTAEVAFS